MFSAPNQTCDVGRFWMVFVDLGQSWGMWRLWRAKDEFVGENGSKTFQNHSKTVKNI